MVILLVSTAFAAWARNRETLEQLIARANSAPLSQQPNLYVEVADRELKLTLDAYKAGDANQAHSSLQAIVEYADKARAASLQSGKRVKHTEIKMRELSLRLRDLKTNIDIDDQPLVQSAVDKLEDFRTQLLKSMFGSKNND
jgi:predicted MarR family transcription regulator